MVSHPAKCMYVWERRAHLTALQFRSVLGFHGFMATLRLKLPLHGLNNTSHFLESIPPKSHRLLNSKIMLHRLSRK